MTARDARRFDFSLPGCIQSFRAEAEGGDAVRIFQVAQPRRTGGGGLRLLAATAEPGAPVRLFLLTYYHPSDFNDSRYDPSFSPVAYPGQRLRACVRAPRPLRARLFFEDDRTGEIQRGERVCLAPGVWTELTLRIPAGTTRASAAWAWRRGTEAGVDLLLDEFAIEGGADYAVNFGPRGRRALEPPARGDQPVHVQLRLLDAGGGAARRPRRTPCRDLHRQYDLWRRLRAGCARAALRPGAQPRVLRPGRGALLRRGPGPGRQGPPVQEAPGLRGPY